MSGPIRIRVDASNPGQFFACCGLFELADRFWDGARGWFDDESFLLQTLTERQADLAELIQCIGNAGIRVLPVAGDEEKTLAAPFVLGTPFDLYLNWWNENGPVRKLKVWAGKMDGPRIAGTMKNQLLRPEFQSEDVLQRACIAYEATSGKKVEPFYFDGRRGAGALPLDIGFGTDPLKMETMTHPAVEFLCLAGLQRCRPRSTDTIRVFEYFTWEEPLLLPLAPAAVAGLIPEYLLEGFRFECAFRTGQKKHKAFTPAVRLERRPS